MGIIGCCRNIQLPGNGFGAQYLQPTPSRSPGPRQAHGDVRGSSGGAAERRGWWLRPLPAPYGAAVAGREEGLLRDRHRRYGLRVHPATRAKDGCGTPLRGSETPPHEAKVVTSGRVSRQLHVMLVHDDDTRDGWMLQPGAVSMLTQHVSDNQHACSATRHSRGYRSARAS